ncbi:ATP-binding protein [Amycolatopsis viridis]|uniref:histidine kinase n=1 Tax=Amycolatopsis viridis TaxID=185678 RepID=A0ABX0SWD9_9PSEU|nr:ATP-binding protein [Amycolatopsis viridis]NIH80848.1 signal transduction histidine kinase [Amycolatopsis viridis]
MTAVPDRRQSRGRRRGDRHADELRALIHDIGHAVAAVSFLVESALSDDLTAASARRKLELVHTQTRMLTTLIEQAFRPAGGGQPIPLRALLAQLTEQADATGPAQVTLLDGPEPETDLDGGILWRILSNLLGNAARAAGRGGTVSVGITGVQPIVIEIADDGPGFGEGEPGWATLGLAAVRKLSRELGVHVSFARRAPAGTLVRVTLAPHGYDDTGTASGRDIR